MKNLLLLSAIAAVGATAAFGADPTEKTVLDLMDAWKKAMMTKDRAMLDKLYAPNLAYTHSSGKNESKTEAIDAVVKGKGKFEAIEFGPTTVQLYGNTAVVKRIVDIRTNTEGKVANNHLDILHVWVKNPSGWQMAARQATRIQQ